MSVGRPSPPVIQVPVVLRLLHGVGGGEEVVRHVAHPQPVAGHVQGREHLAEGRVRRRRAPGGGDLGGSLMSRI